MRGESADGGRFFVIDMVVHFARLFLFCLLWDVSEWCKMKK